MNPPVITYGPGLHPVLENLDRQSYGSDRLFELQSVPDRSGAPTATPGRISLETTVSSSGSSDGPRESGVEGQLASDVVFIAAHAPNPSPVNELRSLFDELDPDRFLVCSVLVESEEWSLRGEGKACLIEAIRDRSDFLLPVRTPGVLRGEKGHRSPVDASDRTAKLVSSIVRKLRNRIDQSPSRVKGLERILKMDRRDKERFLRICHHGLQ